MKIKKRIYIGGTLCLMANVSYADHPTIAFGAESSGPVTTIAASSMPAGTWGFGLRSELIDNDAFSTEELEDFAEDGEEGVHSVDRITSTSISLSYGVTDKLSINARLPYIERVNIRESEIEDGEAEAHTHGDSSGFGDILFLGQYQVSKNDDANIAVQFGLKVPTGETDVKDDDGVKFETEFQPGSGSFDFLIGSAISKNINGISYHANILYNLTTEGSQSTEIGDALSYNLALSYRLKGEDHSLHNHQHDESESAETNWDLMIELNGETRSKNKIADESEENSGGTVVYISPGARVSSGKFSGFVSLGVPVIEDQNGEQTDIDMRLVAGLSIAL